MIATRPRVPSAARPQTCGREQLACISPARRMRPSNQSDTIGERTVEALAASSVVGVVVPADWGAKAAAAPWLHSVAEAALIVEPIDVLGR